MTEQRPSLEEIDKNPVVAGKTEDQKTSLVSIEAVSNIAQEGHELKRQFAAQPTSPEENKELATLMEKEVNQALKVGTDEYAVLSAIHAGAEKGKERSKGNPLINLIRDGIDVIKYYFRKKS